MIELDKCYQFTKDQIAELDALREEVEWLKTTLEKRGASEKLADYMRGGTITIESTRNANERLQKENAHLIQQYGELQEAARKVVRYWGIRHESYLKEYISYMDKVIHKHIDSAV